MMTDMRTKLLKLLLPCMLGAMALPAMAANGVTEDEVLHDARMDGYSTPDGKGTSTTLQINPPSGSAGTWFLTVALGVVCFGAMCKNGKRTHLD